MKKLQAAALVILLAGIALFTTSGSFLIINNPEKVDLIVVLAGETNGRPERGVELLRQGYAPRMLLDVPANAKIFGVPMIEIAQKYVDALPERRGISICPVPGLSTKAEAQDVASCLGAVPARRILLVTSDYHTRRAMSVFRHEIPGHDFSVAASTDPVQFGASWWKHRQWAKMNFDEWLKSVWWYAVDRWR